MTIVVDASLAVKWFLDEADSDLADIVLVSQIGQINVPVTFAIEVVATLVREANIDKANAATMREAIARLTHLMSDGSITIRAESPKLIAQAADIAIGIGHPLKDCIYLALAMELECELVTCDTHFAAKAEGEWAKVRILGG